MVMVTDSPIDTAKAYDLIGKRVSGSVVLHYAVVKENSGGDRPTSCIDYRPEEGIEAELEGIAADLKGEWTLEDVLLIRRAGCLKVGDIISLVAASSPNSEDAFRACMQGIARLKKMKSVTKREVYA